MASGVKTGGRRKGTPNKRTNEFAEKFDQMAEKYADPVEVLFSMIADDEADNSVKRSAAAELLQYRYPKRKAIEHSGEISHKSPSEMTDDEILSRLAEIRAATTGGDGAQDTGEESSDSVH